MTTEKLNKNRMVRFKLDESTYQEFKIKTVKENTSIQKLLYDFVQGYLKK